MIEKSNNIYSKKITNIGCYGISDKKSTLTEKRSNSRKTMHYS